MPVHEKALQDLEDKFAAERRRWDEAWDEILGKFGQVMGVSSGVTVYLREGAWISANFLAALRKIPKPLALQVLAVLGQDREKRRAMLEDTMSKEVSHHNSHDLLSVERMAKERGEKGIPLAFVTPHEPRSSEDYVDFDAEAAAIPD